MAIIERNVKDLNFRVTNSFHRKVKLQAMDDNITMKELMIEAIDLYMAKHSVKVGEPEEEIDASSECHHCKCRCCCSRTKH